MSNKRLVVGVEKDLDEGVRRVRELVAAQDALDVAIWPVGQESEYCHLIFRSSGAFEKLKPDIKKVCSTVIQGYLGYERLFLYINYRDLLKLLENLDYIAIATSYVNGREDYPHIEF